jgi:hypothetical protein
VSAASLLDEPLHNLFPLSEAARRLPPRRQGRPVSASTPWRWATVGCRSADGRIVKLAAVRVGCTWMTSERALAKFLRALQPDAAGAEVSHAS